MRRPKCNMPTFCESAICARLISQQRKKENGGDRGQTAEEERDERAAYLANIGRDKQAVSTSDAPKLRFSESDLNNFVAHRKTGLAAKSLDWIDRASLALWKSTKGEVSRRTVTTLRESVLAKYSSPDSHS